MYQMTVRLATRKYSLAEKKKLGELDKNVNRCLFGIKG